MNIFKGTMCLVALIFLFAHPTFAQDVKKDTDRKERYKASNKVFIKDKKQDLYKDAAPGRHFPTILNPAGSTDYTETVFRRFDIIFFLAYPVFVFYQFIINELVAQYYKTNYQARGSFSTNQFLYIFLSSVILGIAVSYDDYKAVDRGYYSSSEYFKKDEQSISLVLLQFDF